MAELEAFPLFESGLVQATDVNCHAHKSGYGADEVIESPRLIFPRRGVFECRLPGETVTADSNIVLLFNQADTYRVSHPCEGGDDCSVLVFPPEMLSDALAEHHLPHPHPESRPFQRPYLLLDPETQLQQRLFHHTFSVGLPDRLHKEEAAVFILSRVAGQLAQSLQTQARPTGRRHTPLPIPLWLENTRACLASAPQADLSLQELARQVFCSPFHLARVFQQHVGLSLHQYRLRLRLALALERLAGGEDDLTRLALELGFSSHSHFSASFKHTFQRTPAQVRAELTRTTLAACQSRLKPPL